MALSFFKKKSKENYLKPKFTVLEGEPKTEEEYHHHITENSKRANLNSQIAGELKRAITAIAEKRFKIAALNETSKELLSKHNASPSSGVKAETVLRFQNAAVDLTDLNVKLENFRKNVLKKSEAGKVDKDVFNTVNYYLRGVQDMLRKYSGSKYQSEVTKNPGLETFPETPSGRIDLLHYLETQIALSKKEHEETAKKHSNASKVLVDAFPRKFNWKSYAAYVSRIKKK